MAENFMSGLRKKSVPELLQLAKEGHSGAIEHLHKLGIKYSDYHITDTARPYNECVEEFIQLFEAYYPGNIGLMELAKFMQMASDKQKRQFHDHLNGGRHRDAMRLVSTVTGMPIHPSAYETAS